MKMKLLAAMLALTAAGSANAAMDGATSGNGSLLVNFIYQGGTSATSGGDDMSAVFDLGVSMNDVIAWNGVSGYTQTWSLTTANYGSAWNDLLAFAVTDTAIQYNVIALDSTNASDFAGGSRYLSTGDTSFASVTNANLNGFDGMDAYVTANNSRGTHGTEANGASIATPTDVANSYFRAINGAGQGDTWLAKTTEDTTKTVGTAQNFWSLTTTAPGGNTASAKTAFGYDLDGDGIIEASGAFGNEFGTWSVNLAAGTITYLNPAAIAPVPEADTWAMLLAGLGMVGMIARRRRVGAA